jgi:hypothetical protein
MQTLFALLLIIVGLLSFPYSIPLLIQGFRMLGN